MYQTVRPILIFTIAVFCVASTSAKDITISDRVDQVSELVYKRIKPLFRRQRINYPPGKLVLVAVKDEKRLKVYAQGDDDSWHFIWQYTVARLSGDPGPKLRSGDKQVPEGIYSITHLNPQSKYWLSLALNYPNAFDRKHARADGRKSLGGDIMIHGWWFSEGCIAVGNTAAEDLFVLAHDVGIDNMKVIITPTDFRSDESDYVPPTKPAWTSDLYDSIKTELNKLGSDGLTSDSRLVAYADIAPPPPPKPTTLFGKVLRALAEAAETSKTESQKSK